MVRERVFISETTGRLDAALLLRFPSSTRAFVREAVADGAVLVDRLFREPTLDVRAVSGGTIEYGELEHCDALVISHPNKKSFTRYVREFAKRGGCIVAFGSEKELKTIPADLPNVTACKSADAVRLAPFDAEIGRWTAVDAGGILRIARLSLLRFEVLPVEREGREIEGLGEPGLIGLILFGAVGNLVEHEEVGAVFEAVALLL